MGSYVGAGRALLCSNLFITFLTDSIEGASHCVCPRSHSVAQVSDCCKARCEKHLTGYQISPQAVQYLSSGVCKS